VVRSSALRDGAIAWPRRASLYLPGVIRDATVEDWPAIWPIYSQIVRAADTFSYDPAIGEDAAREMWMVRPPGRTTVAVDDDGTIAGTANMFANRPGPGDHVASGNYMVGAARRGQGIGRALIDDSLQWARASGFRAMQFNAVAESNTPAVQLYERMGFATVGRVPDAFRHPEHGEVALLVMHRSL
jgi:L-amino acid N-acyltransferase YncA